MRGGAPGGPDLKKNAPAWGQPAGPPGRDAVRTLGRRSGFPPPLAPLDRAGGPMSAVAIIVGCALILITLQDAFEVVLLPRRVSRRVRFTTLFFRVGWGLWRVLAAPLRAEAARERFLSVFGPLAMLT